MSGYYLYLPAAFIYHDLRDVAFLDDIIARYRPTASPYQVFDHESGARVMKYSLGQAVMYSPFFAVAHAWASADPRYPPDGFSLPYQFMISLGSLVVCFLGLYWLAAFLRYYFGDRAVALTVVLVALGTNYLNYTAIDGAMTHNNVFTLYALLLLTSHRFYRRPTWGRAALIGACVGLMALTRPTEIIAALIPLLWGLDLTKTGSVPARLAFFGRHAGKLGLAAVITLAIGSLQLLYWKYVSGDWLVYSYQDQGFDWLSPHLNKGFFSYKAGWLIYTPLMVFALAGFWPLRRRPGVLLPALVHAVVFIYVAFSWSVWWYGGSLGQRTMVQAYAVLALPFAAFVEWCFGLYRADDNGARTQVQGKGQRPWWRYVVAAVMALFVWHSLYFTHQAHVGRLYLTEQMNAAYFWRILYKFERDPEDQLRLDTPEFFPGEPTERRTLLTRGFDDLPTDACGMDPITGTGAVCLIGQQQSSPKVYAPLDLAPGHWVRARVNAKVNAYRGNRHNYAQMVIAFRRDGAEVKRRLIRMNRVLNADWRRSLHIDSRVPDGGADEVVVWFWNGGNTQPALIVDDLVIEALR